MGCKKVNITMIDTITCAKICNSVNFIIPVVDYTFENWSLTGNGTDEYLHKWQILDEKNNILFDTGYGEYNDSLTNPSNGSTHGILNLGVMNVDIFALLINFYVSKSELFIKYKIQHKTQLYEFEKIKYYINEE